jgi:hypothetical protein
MHLCSPPYELHTQPISFIYFMLSTNHYSFVIGVTVLCWILSILCTGYLVEIGCSETLLYPWILLQPYMSISNVEHFSPELNASLYICTNLSLTTTLHNRQLTSVIKWKSNNMLRPHLLYATLHKQ